jgi:flagellin
MAISDISLTSGMRSNLVNLQTTAKLLDRTQVRLSTGKKVNTALDDPVNFFAAQGHTNRAADLAALKDGMSEAIQTVKAADAGITGISSLIEAARGLAQAARSADSTGRAALSTQFDNLRTQLDRVAKDSGYKGTDLLDTGPKTLKVIFDEGGASSLTITGFDATTTGLTISAAAGSWATDANIDAAVTQLTSAVSTLRAGSATLAANLNIISVRQEFTTSMIATLQKGADNLTLADMNEEGANMLMLQTRQSLSTTALSLASQAAQSVLRLFG